MIGKEQTGKVSGYSHEGMGVVRVDSAVYFIPGALEGEEIRFQAPEPKTGKRAPVFGQLTEILTSSPSRVAPPCPYYADCGGCQLQHAAYPHQLEIKEQILSRALRPLAKLDSALAEKQRPVLPSSEETGYRNKGIFAVGRQDGGRPLIGFYQRKSRKIAGLGCPLLFSREVNGLIAAVSFFLEGHPEAVLGPGGLHHLMIRESKTTGQLILILICAGQKPAWLKDFLALFVPKAPEDLPPCAPPPRRLLSGIGWLTAPDQDGPVLRGRPETLWGSLVLVERLRGLNFGITPQSFFQVNTRQADVLYAEAAKAAALTGSEILWDLYCGTGTITLCLAGQAKRALGVEFLEEAAAGARKNAALNQIKNAEFLAGSAEALLPKYQGPAPDVVVLDPPAKGADAAVLAAILAAAPKRIVYVSCDPATLARDLSRLVGEGAYRVEAVQPVDLFPQTAHIETVVSLKREP